MSIDPITIGIIAVALMLVTMFLRLWVAVSLMIISYAGIWYIAGWDTAYQVLGAVPFSQMANYTMVCMPLFVVMGTFLTHSNIGADLFICVRSFIGHIRGGLAMATIGACGMFAAICGESTATALTMGKIAYPEMIKYNYKNTLASCCIVCGGTLGILIPPSVTMIIYGVLVEESIGKLFIAGIVPGLMQVFFYCLTIFILCRVKPDLGPASENIPVKEKVKTVKNIWPVVVLFIVIIGGIYGGIFTPTEAGGAGAFFALVIVVLKRRFTKKFFADATLDALQASTMVFCLLIGAYLFMRFISLTGLTGQLTNALITFQATHNIPNTVMIILIFLVYFVLGMFLDGMAIMLLTVPIIYPIVMAMGYDSIWWGIMMVRYAEMAMISPPYGLNIFVMSKAIKTPLLVLYKGVWPFLLSDFVQVAIIIAFPAIVTFLPNQM